MKLLCKTNSLYVVFRMIFIHYIHSMYYLLIKVQKKIKIVTSVYLLTLHGVSYKLSILYETPRRVSFYSCMFYLSFLHIVIFLFLWKT